MINLSLHLGATYDELVMAGRDPDRLLVVEINPNLPRTRSLPPQFTNTIPLDLVDVVVEADGAPYALGQAAPDDIDAAIATGPGRSSPTGPPSRSASARCPTWWRPSWPRGRVARTGSTARCSPTG